MSQKLETLKTNKSLFYVNNDKLETIFTYFKVIITNT